MTELDVLGVDFQTAGDVALETTLTGRCAELSDIGLDRLRLPSRDAVELSIGEVTLLRGVFR